MIDKSLWETGSILGNVSYFDGTIVAQPHTTQRSEFKLHQNHPLDCLKKYHFSFKISGDSNLKAVVFQFHDWWDIPENIITNKKVLYLAAPPPLTLRIDKGKLLFMHNALTSDVYFDHRKEHFIVLSQKRSHYIVRDLQLDSWIDLDLEVYWTTSDRGFLKYNGKMLAENIVTMFNKNPCDIQCGLYLNEHCTSNTIRKILC